MSFLYTSLLALGLPLLVLPLAIHLINLRRRQRVEWAAMQFLLESQKRNRKWIVLRQVLLLLLRTAAIGLAVFMLAGPVVRSGWANLFGSGVTHHVILLDDSYSMSDQWDETTALEEAKRVVLRVLDQARTRSDDQLVTLLRFSEARSLAAGDAAAFDREPLDLATFGNLERFLGQLKPSESGAGPIEALQAATRLPEAGAGETIIAYLITDFRRPQWQEQAQIRQLMSRLRERSRKLLLVQCAYDERPNLSVTTLAPESGIRAANVETWMELSVANYGDQAASNVTAAVEQNGERLPAVVIDDVPPGESATRRFRVKFPKAGPHHIAARLEADSVAADNTRYFAAQIPAAFRILVIDGSAAGDDGFYLRTALSPGGRNLAGWMPQVEPASFLRRHERLGDYAVICLLDVSRLDDPEVTALEEYVQSGGGLAIVLGPQTVRSFYNDRLYRDGAGLLPAPLDVPAQLLRDSRTMAADIDVTDHPVFRVFTGERNSFLSVANVDFYFGVDPLWQAPANGDVRVLARLRNRAPLFLEKQFGAGRVIAALTKLSPRSTELGAWSNLSLNPAFPVLANELVGYLSATRRRYDERGVDEPLQIAVPESGYLPDVRVRRIGAPGEAASIVPDAVNGQFVVAAPGEPQSGVWEFQLTTRDGKPETRVLAVNVPTGEGDLHLLRRSELDELLRGIDFEFSLASQFADADDRIEGARVADALLYALIAALVAEQLLAVSASYHATGTRAAA